MSKKKKTVEELLTDLHTEMVFWNYVKAIIFIAGIYFVAKLAGLK